MTGIKFFIFENILKNMQLLFVKLFHFQLKFHDLLIFELDKFLFISYSKRNSLLEYYV